MIIRKMNIETIISQLLFVFVSLLNLSAKPIYDNPPEQTVVDTFDPPAGENALESDFFLKEKLRQVFELDDAVLWKSKPGVSHMQAPQYMLDLYRQTADMQSGLTKSKNIYGANLVRSFANKGYSEKMHFWFDVAKMNKTAQKKTSLLAAEFHVYKHVKKGNNSDQSKDKFLQLALYQITADGGKQSLKYLDGQILPVHGSGWQVFSLKEVVSYWLANPEENLGLILSVTDLENKPISVENSVVEIVTNLKAKNQPILFVFADEISEKKAYPEYSPENSLSETVPEDSLPETVSRRRRSSSEPISDQQMEEEQSLGKSESFNIQSDQAPSSKNRGCSRLPLYVDFTQIGWSGWIISPSGYNAYYCDGECPFPLSQHHRPSNHATVQSIVNAIGTSATGGKKVPKPCCVPDRLYSISLLYFDDGGDVILKQYDDMVAASCGCH